MRQRFTVIQGGVATERPPVIVDGPVRWQVDLRRPAEVGEAEIAAWRGLLVRAGSDTPIYADPDFLLAAAQHQAGGRDLVFAFAWTRSASPEHLRAVVPLALPHPLWGNGRIGPWQPHGIPVAPTAEAASFGEMRAALSDRLRAIRPRAVLTLAEDAPLPVSGGTGLRSVPNRPSIPSAALVGIRPSEASVQDRPAVERISEPDRIRDAVEEFLVLDAEVSSAPIIGDPSEAALVRVVTRLFARRRQACVELTRRGGTVVAAKLSLGAGAQAVVWRKASMTERDRARTA